MVLTLKLRAVQAVLLGAAIAIAAFGYPAAARAATAGGWTTFGTYPTTGIAVSSAVTFLGNLDVSGCSRFTLMAVSNSGVAADIDVNAYGLFPTLGDSGATATNINVPINANAFTANYAVTGGGGVRIRSYDVPGLRTVRVGIVHASGSAPFDAGVSYTCDNAVQEVGLITEQHTDATTSSVDGAKSTLDDISAQLAGTLDVHDASATPSSATLSADDSQRLDIIAYASVATVAALFVLMIAPHFFARFRFWQAA